MAHGPVALLLLAVVRVELAPGDRKLHGPVARLFRRDELELITDQLMEHEVLNRDDLFRLLGKPAGYEEKDESEEQDEVEDEMESVEGPAGLPDASSDDEDVSIESETIDEKMADQNELGTVDETLLNQANRQLREGDS